jgi:hypothetical protein
MAAIRRRVVSRRQAHLLGNREQHFNDRKRAAECGEGGASRTRTGDLLGAISALSWPEFRFTTCFPSRRASSPNTFINSLQPVLQ